MEHVPNLFYLKILLRFPLVHLLIFFPHNENDLNFQFFLHLILLVSIIILFLLHLNIIQLLNKHMATFDLFVVPFACSKWKQSNTPSVSMRTVLFGTKLFGISSFILFFFTFYCKIIFNCFIKEIFKYIYIIN